MKIFGKINPIELRSGITDSSFQMIGLSFHVIRLIVGEFYRNSRKFLHFIVTPNSTSLYDLPGLLCNFILFYAHIMQNISDIVGRMFAHTIYNVNN